MIDRAVIEEMLNDLPFKAGVDEEGPESRHAWMREQGIDPSLETGVGAWAMAEVRDDGERIHAMLADGVDVPVAVMRLAMQSAAYELGFIVGWLARGLDVVVREEP